MMCIVTQPALRPVVFYLHGGGLVSLSTTAYDKLLRRMTNLLGAADGVIVSIDYRRDSTLEAIQRPRDEDVCF